MRKCCGCFILFVSSMRLVFGPHNLVALLLYHMSILRSPWHFMVFVPSEMSCSAILCFCLAPGLSGASFALKHYCLRFRDVCLAPSFCRALFLLECFHLHFHYFDLAPSLLGASFLPEHFCLRFRNFDLAPSLLWASFLTEHFRLRFHDFELAPSFCRVSSLLCCLVKPVGDH
jgi:hypothetical protein